MASFVDVSNLTYCGKEIQRIFSEDVYGLDLRSYGITLMDGIKGKTKIYNGELGDMLMPYTCPFTPNGAVSLDESYIEPVAIKSNLEECYSKFWGTYLVEQTSISLNGGVPAAFGEWFFAKYRAKLAKEYQEIFWAGDSTYSGATKTYLKVTDGIEKQLADSSASTKISGAVMTVNNVLGQVEAVITSGLSVAGQADVATDGWKVFMNYQDVNLLKMALGKVCCPNNQSIFSNYAKEGDKVYIFGYEVVPTMQSRNKIIFGPSANLVLGFDTYDAHLEYKFIDMRTTTGDDMFRIINISNIAVGIILPALFTISEP